MAVDFGGERDGVVAEVLLEIVQIPAGHEVESRVGVAQIVDADPGQLAMVADEPEHVPQARVL